MTLTLGDACVFSHDNVLRRGVYCETHTAIQSFSFRVNVDAVCNPLYPTVLHRCPHFVKKTHHILQPAGIERQVQKRGLLWVSYAVLLINRLLISLTVKIIVK